MNKIVQQIRFKYENTVLATIYLHLN